MSWLELFFAFLSGSIIGALSAWRAVANFAITNPLDDGAVKAFGESLRSHKMTLWDKVKIIWKYSRG